MLNTTSTFISFHGELEDRIRAFYEHLASGERYPEARETFLALAKENRKHKEMVLRTYREVITDAFEGGFPLTALNKGDYEIDTELVEDMSLHEVLKKAIEMEETSQKFCRDAAESTRGLMADVPLSFEWVARRKDLRKRKLESLA